MNNSGDGTRVSVIGLPGGGKSTLCNALQISLGGSVILEDPASFRFLMPNPGREPHYGAMSQIEFLTSKAKDEVPRTAGIIWQEVDTRYCHEVWTRSLQKVGELTGDDLFVVNEVGNLLNDICALPTAWISMDMTLDHLISRISGRARKTEVIENEVTEDYVELLAALLESHMEFVEKHRVSWPPMINLDALMTPEEILEHSIRALQALNII